MNPRDTLFVHFPHADHRIEILSPSTWDYNCIAWAAGISDQFWWPQEGTYWPDPTERRTTIDVFQDVFRSLFGYEDCADSSLEEAYEKVAIYGFPGEVTHMARQMPNGWWWSKLGPSYDIQHVTPECLIGTDYGRPMAYMRRRIVKEH